MNKPRPAHNPHNFPIKSNELLIGGIPVSRLAARVGQTPFYAYDRQAISQRVKDLRAIMPAELKLHYALKANPMPAVVQHFATLVDGFDLASGNEMRVALDTTMAAENISFAGPGKSKQELSSAIAAGVTINLESETELSTVIKLSEILSVKAKVAVRINPDFELKASGMKMGGGSKQFGIDAELVPDLLKKIKQADLNFVGFHIFSGSQNLKPDAVIEAQSKTFELAFRLAEHTPATVEKLNIGGGLGIPYFPGDKPLELNGISENLQELINQAKTKLPQTAIVMELGRYLIGEAGVYVCKIVDKKVSRGETFLITNGGLHHHLAASGNFGQIIRKNYPITIANKTSSAKMETVNIVGPLCTPLDILGNKMELPEAEIGDLVAVFQSGAYGYTASPTAFLSQPLPLEILV